MKRILLILILTTQIVNSQIKQTREVKELFISSLNIPSNERNMEYATKSFAKEKNIKRITFLIGDSIVGYNHYDKSGNLIQYKLNNHLTVYEYDENQRLISKKNFKNLTEFTDGYIFEYSHNSKLTYRLKKNKILKSKRTILEDQGIETTTEYLENGKIDSRTIKVLNESDKIIGKTQFYKNHDGLNTQRHTIFFEKDKIPNELLLTYLENQEEISQRNTTRQNYVYDKHGNQVKRMIEGFTNCEYTYNSKNRIIKTQYISKENGIWKTVSYEYENDTILKRKLEINLIKEQRKTLEYKYNPEKELKTIIRTNGEFTDIFNYSYEYY